MTTGALVTTAAHRGDDRTVTWRRALSREHIPYLIASLFLLHVAFNGNYTQDLIGDTMQELLQKRWMQHLTGYGVLLFTLSFVSSVDAWASIWMSAALYALFVLTTKMHREPTLLVLFLLATCFILKQLLDRNYTRAWQQEADASKHAAVRAGLETAIVVLWGVILLTTCVGVGCRLRTEWKVNNKNMPWRFFFLRFLYRKLPLAE